MMTDQVEAYEGWAILELMGHRRLAGYLRAVQLAGAGMLRIDVPGPDGTPVVATQFYSPASVYCITPTTEPIARAIAARTHLQPAQQWELMPMRSPEPASQHDFELEPDDHND